MALTVSVAFPEPVTLATFRDPERPLDRVMVKRTTLVNPLRDLIEMVELPFALG